MDKKIKQLAVACKEWIESREGEEAIEQALRDWIRIADHIIFWNHIEKALKANIKKSNQKQEEARL